jgi:hypothetical protein
MMLNVAYNEGTIFACILSVVMLNVACALCTIFCLYTECGYAECHYAECRLCWMSLMLNVAYAECCLCWVYHFRLLSVAMLSVVLLGVIMLNVNYAEWRLFWAECHYGECRSCWVYHFRLNAECGSAQCRYADYTIFALMLSAVMLKINYHFERPS